MKRKKAMRRQPRNLQPKPTVARHFQSLGADKFAHNLNVHMFTEDVHLAVMPIGGRSHKGYSISLNGSKVECERAARLIENIARHDRPDLAGSVCDAVEEVARQLSWEGCAVFEIIPSEEDVPFLYGFTSTNLVKLFGWFVQIIPKGDWALWGKKWALVHSSRIWRIEMPTALGGRRGYVAMINRLKRFDPIGPTFWRVDLENSKQSNQYDFQIYNRNSEIYRSKVTKTWGWNRRDWSQERTTEFFCFYKHVTFRWAQAVLREHIIAELNSLLRRLEIECEIVVSGLPISGEIMEVKRKLLAGEISFASASDKVSIS